MVSKVCRLCAKEKKRGFEIYQDEGLKLKLSTKIIRCLQIRVRSSLYLAEWGRHSIKRNFQMYCRGFLIFNFFQVYPDDLLPKMVCTDCCFKLNQSSEFFDRSSQAQTVLQMAVGAQRRTTTDGVGVYNVVAIIMIKTCRMMMTVLHRYWRLSNFPSSLSVFTARKSTGRQRLCSVHSFGEFKSEW
jgi:hypothetical protein